MRQLGQGFMISHQFRNLLVLPQSGVKPISGVKLAQDAIQLYHQPR
jgi:hypothetical protein